MKPDSETKVLKNGKLSFKLPMDLREFVMGAITRRLVNEKDFIDHHTYFALYEALYRIQVQLHEKRISLMCSHFYVVFCSDTMRYVGADTQILIGAHLGKLDKMPLPFVKPPQRPLVSITVSDEELDDIPI